jgi:hypothetical protein
MSFRLSLPAKPVLSNAWIGILAALIWLSTHLDAFGQSARSESFETQKREKVRIKKTQKPRKEDLPDFKYATGKNEFLEERMKERRETLKDRKAPQYTNKLYFGHKKPPKKRPLHRRKYCNECGMTH